MKGYCLRKKGVGCKVFEGKVPENGAEDAALQNCTVFRENFLNMQLNAIIVIYRF